MEQFLYVFRMEAESFVEAMEKLKIAVTTNDDEFPEPLGVWCDTICTTEQTPTAARQALESAAWTLFRHLNDKVYDEKKKFREMEQICSDRLDRRAGVSTDSPA